MKYKITQQYARDEEKLLAEFCEVSDALFFIERKLLVDQENHLTIIYRIFDNHQLFKDFNKDKITTRINPAQYAQGDRDLPNKLGSFKVGKDASAVNALESFINLNDAELFVEDKLTQTSEITTYYIFNNDVLMMELNQRIKKRFQS